MGAGCGAADAILSDGKWLLGAGEHRLLGEPKMRSAAEALRSVAVPERTAFPRWPYSCWEVASCRCQALITRANERRMCGDFKEKDSE